MAESEFFACCFTGYRPQKFPFEFGSHTKEFFDFENSLMSVLFDLLSNGCRTFISGMAMGFDIIAAECVLLLAQTPRYINEEIKLVCAIPFDGQANKYPDDWKERYDEVLARAYDTIKISNEYYPECYYDRNRFMVDNSDCVVTWFDGRNGGTKNTLCYAKKKGRKIINLNSEYEYG